MRILRCIILLILPLGMCAQNSTYEIRALFSPVYYFIETRLENEYVFSYNGGLGINYNLTKHVAANVDVFISDRNYNQYTNVSKPISKQAKEYQDSYTYLDASTKLSFMIINKKIKFTVNPGVVWSFQISKKRTTIDYDNNKTEGFWYKCDFTEHPIYLYLGTSFKRYFPNKIGIELEPFFRYKANKESPYAPVCPFDTGKYSCGLSLILFYFKGK